MTDGNTHAIAQHLDEREDWDALQEVTVELEQAEAKVEELETKLEDYKRLMLTLAGDKIDLVSELAGVKFKLAKTIDFVAEVGGGLKFGDSLVDWANLQVLKARTLLAELTKERSDEKGETDE